MRIDEPLSACLRLEWKAVQSGWKIGRVVVKFHFGGL
jgi:hypothetical protein